METPGFDVFVEQLRIRESRDHIFELNIKEGSKVTVLKMESIKCEQC